MESERIAVVDLADEMRVRKQRVFKVLKRLGIRTTSRRETARRNQLVATISPDEAATLRREIAAGARTQTSDVESHAPSPSYVSETPGLFYLIQLEPSHDEGRFKVGFTSDLEDRLRKHRCSAPLLRLVKTWACRNTWERTAIDSVTDGCERLHTEVFRASSIAAIVSRTDSFFAVMPGAPSDERHR